MFQGIQFPGVVSNLIPVNTDRSPLSTDLEDGLSLSCLQVRFRPSHILIPHKTDTIAIFDSAALLRRPMIAQCGTAAVLFGSGDLIAQQAIEKKGLKGHDVRALLSPFLAILWRSSMEGMLIMTLESKWTRTARLSFYGGEGPHAPCNYL